MSDRIQTKDYMPVVASILAERQPRTVLDVPSGSGWLGALLSYGPIIDGADLFADKPSGYRTFYRFDLDAGLPDHLPEYDAIVSCEGIEHFANPGLFLQSAKHSLIRGGY
jgi:2-polyprenyl-3-methyl-5-hydroxy-6-metoxy-1,4-benzoquinol methylase